MTDCHSTLKQTASVGAMMLHNLLGGNYINKADYPVSMYIYPQVASLHNRIPDNSRLQVS